VIRWFLALALLTAATWFAFWLQWRQEETPLARLKRDSFLKDLVPGYHRTQQGERRKQHREVQRYPRRIA
jgi:hypothetical protein